MKSRKNIELQCLILQCVSYVIPLFFYLCVYPKSNVRLTVMSIHSSCVNSIHHSILSALHSVFCYQPTGEFSNEPTIHQ